MSTTNDDVSCEGSVIEDVSVPGFSQLVRVRIPEQAGRAVDGTLHSVAPRYATVKLSRKLQLERVTLAVNDRVRVLVPREVPAIDRVAIAIAKLR